MNTSDKPKISQVGIVVKTKSSGDFEWVTTLCDDQEIKMLEEAILKKQNSALEKVIEHREHKRLEDEEFGDYVEHLLTQPFVSFEIQNHGIEWLKSKIKMETFQKTEFQAAQVIAEYGFKTFLQNPSQKDFTLSSATNSVAVKILVLPEAA